MNLIDKAVTGLERIDYTFEGSYAVGRMPPNSISCYREISPEIDVATFIVLALKITTTTSTITLISQQPSNQIQTLHQQRYYHLLKTQIIVSLL